MRLTVRIVLALAVFSGTVGPAHADRPVIAVFNIEDRGVGLSNELILRLSDYLAMQLAATGSYQLVPRDQLKKRLTRQKRASYKQCYRQTCQIEIGKELAAEKSLATSIMKLGSRCMLTSILFDLRKSASEGGASAGGACHEDGIVTTLQALVRKLVPRSKVVSPKSTPPKDRGGILIKSQPKGATVKLDGLRVQGTTPLTVTDLAPGEHLLEVSKEDYRYAGKVIVKADDYTTVNLRLKKALVRLEVLSDPPEATILLNGQQMGKTPKILRNVKAGDHVIELRRPGYAAETQSLRLGAGTRRQTIRVSLKKAAFIAVQSAPSGATVQVDGATRGITPTTVTVAPGEHKLRLTRAGMEPATTTVTVKEGAKAQVSLPLRPNVQSRRRLISAKAQLQEQARAELRYKAQVEAYDQRYGSAARSRRTKTILGYTSLAAGAALVVTAAVLYGVGASQGDDAHQQYQDATQSPPTAELADVAQQRSEVEGAQTKMNVATALLGLGLTAGGFAVYELLTRPTVPERPVRPAARARLGVWASGSGGGAMITGSL